MLAGTIAFTLGAWFCMQLRVLPDSILIGFAPLFMLLALNPRWRVRCLFMVGLLWTQLFAMTALQARLPRHLEGRELIITGSVRDVPRSIQGTSRQNSDRQQFLFLIETASPDWRRRISRPCLLRLSWYRHAQPLRAGTRWKFQVRLKRPHGSHNPDGPDSELRALSRGICASGYIRTRIQRPEQLPDSALISLLGYRQGLVNSLRQRLSGFATQGIIVALLTGVRDDITAAQRRILQTTGTSHLVAISGLHIGLLAGFGFMLGRGINRLLPFLYPAVAPGRMESAIALLLACLYAALAGFSLPTQRALIMLLVLLLARSLGRKTAVSHALCCALILVLMLDPLAVTNAGLWLSFLAVAGLLYGLADRHCAGLGGRNRMLGALLKVQFIAWITLLPVSLYWFGGISLSSPLTNLIAVPVTGLIVVPLALFAVLVDTLGMPSLANELLEMSATSMDLLLFALAAISDSVPLVHLAIPKPGILTLSGLAAVTLILAPRSFRLRWLGAVWLLPVVLPISAEPSPGSLWLTVFDVGQGLAVAVRTQRHVLVYDTGPGFKGSWDAGTRIIAPQLLRQGIQQLDRLVLSHRHQDHIGGTWGLLNSIALRQLTTNVPPRYLGKLPGKSRTNTCRAGMSWRWDEYQFHILSPSGDRAAQLSVNNASCVLQIRGPGGAIVLTGDIEKQTELELVRETQRGRLDSLVSTVLLAPHHGSRTSSSAAFLGAVDPRWIVISRGYSNRFKFPHRQVMQRYRAQQVKILDTACQGAIQMRMGPDAGHIRVKTWQDRYARFWHVLDDERCLWNAPQGFARVAG